MASIEASIRGFHQTLAPEASVIGAIGGDLRFSFSFDLLFIWNSLFAHQRANLGYIYRSIESLAPSPVIWLTPPSCMVEDQDGFGALSGWWMNGR